MTEETKTYDEDGEKFENHKTRKCVNVYHCGLNVFFFYDKHTHPELFLICAIRLLCCCLSVSNCDDTLRSLSWNSRTSSELPLHLERKQYAVTCLQLPCWVNKTFAAHVFTTGILYPLLQSRQIYVRNRYYCETLNTVCNEMQLQNILKWNPEICQLL